MKRFALAIALMALVPALWAASIDFDTATFYVRSGFDPATIVQAPAPGQGAWLALSARPGRSLAVRDFGLDGYPHPAPFDFHTHASGSFTVACVFEADLSLINTTSLSLFIPQVGQGWVLYLNGLPLRNELQMGEGGRLRQMRSLRNVVIPLDKRSLKEGANVIAFRIYGDPTDDRTGLPGGKSMRIDSYAKLSRSGGEYIDIALIGIYALFALYHFIIYALRPKHHTYLIYGIGALLFSAYLFARSSTATELFPDTGILRIIEYGCLFVVIPIFVAFCETALGRKISIVAVFCLFSGAVLAALLPFYRQESLKFVWEAITAAELLYLFGYIFTPRLVHLARGGVDKAKASLGKIVFSDVGLLALGSLVVSVSTTMDVIAVNAGGDMRFTKYAFLVFVFMASAILAIQFTGVYGEMEGLRVSLERKVAERNAQLADAVERQRRIGVEIEHQARRLSDAKDMAERDLSIAERVQRGIFPTTPPLVPGWDMALAYRPAATISGDFFDFYLEDGKLSGLVLGDVSGHGMGAGLVAVLARSVFARRWAELGKIPLGDLLVRLHADLEGELGGVDEYLTCLLLRIEGNKVEYANAAHPDLLYRRAGTERAVAILPRGKDDFRGPPLGKGGYAGGWAALRFNPGPGDLLLLYTDCFEEAKAPGGERYGKERLLGSLSRAPTDSATSALNAVIADVEAFAGTSTFGDDLSAIMLLREA